MLTPRDTDILAICILASLAGSLLVWAAIGLRRSILPPSQATLAFVSAILARTIWRARISGPMPIPPNQGAIIVCNHNSAVDPWFTQLATNRCVHWMVASEYFHHPAMLWFFRIVKSIPVNRGGIDTSSTKQAIRYVENGELVGLFPEGRINLTDELLLPGRPGSILIALKARVPILPCYIRDAPKAKEILDTFFTPSKTKLFVGPLMDISAYYGREREDGVIQELTIQAMKEIAKLAGRPDFEPKLAGRKWKPEE